MEPGNVCPRPENPLMGGNKDNGKSAFLVHHRGCRQPRRMVKVLDLKRENEQVTNVIGIIRPNTTGGK